MDEITKSAPAPTPPVSRTMSSLEIAKLTDKQHRNVLADIRKTLEEAGINAAEFSAAQPYGKNGNTREVHAFVEEMVPLHLLPKVIDSANQRIARSFAALRPTIGKGEIA
jgi:hypothetical protein